MHSCVFTYPNHYFETCSPISINYEHARQTKQGKQGLGDPNVTWNVVWWADWGNICYTPVNSDRWRRIPTPRAETGLHASMTILPPASTNQPSKLVSQLAGARCNETNVGETFLSGYFSVCLFFPRWSPSGTDKKNISSQAKHHQSENE